MTAGLFRRRSLTASNLTSALFTASLVSKHADLNCRVRSQVSAAVRPFDIYSPVEAMEEVQKAFLKAGVAHGAQESISINEILRAAKQSEDWMEQGIFLIRKDQLKSPFPELHDPPPVFFAFGDSAILEKPSVSILSSRRSRRITPLDPWLLTTRVLAESATEKGCAIVSSYGTPGYFLVSLLSKGFPTIIVCPNLLPFMNPSKGRAKFVSEYGDVFDFRHTLFLSPFPPGTQPAVPQRLLERDHMVAALSCEIHAVDARAGGNMEAVLDVATRRRAPVRLHNTVELEKERGRNRAAKALESREAHGSIKTGLDSGTSKSGRTNIQGAPEDSTANSSIYPSDAHCSEESVFLYHYTRSCPGPWPGQTIGEYWRSLINGCNDAGHTALDTLARILREGVIRAGNKLTRGETRVVCFSECEPSLLRNIVKWRPGLVRWSFEPYAIGIRRASLMKLGALQVIYGKDEDYVKLSESVKHLFQVKMTSSNDWSLEKEWRIVGDITLNAVSCSDIVVIVATMEEEEFMGPQVSYRVESAGIESRV